jgi:hypothetical protein
MSHHPGLNMRNALVSRVDRRRFLGIGALAGVLSMLGCGNAEEGTVKVAPAARERLLPQSGPIGKTKGGEPAPGKTFSIKDRAPVPPPK